MCVHVDKSGFYVLSCLSLLISLVRLIWWGTFLEKVGFMENASVDHTLCAVASMHPIQVMNFCRRFPHMPVYAIAAEMSVLRSDEDMKYLLTRSTKENIQQTFQYLGCMDMHNEIEYVRHLTAQIEREVLMSHIPYPELSTDKKKI